MNRWNELIFCMLIQIHKNLKLIKNLWGGHGQKWMSLRRLKVDSVIFGGAWSKMAVVF